MCSEDPPQIAKPKKSKEKAKKNFEVYRKPSESNISELEKHPQNKQIVTTTAVTEKNIDQQSFSDIPIAKVQKSENNVIQNFSYSAQEFVTLGNAKAEEQKWDEAATLYSKALKLDPNSWKIRRKLGKVLRQKGNLDLALAEFQQAIKLQPKIGELYTDLGETLAQLGKWNEAIVNYRHGIELSPQQPWSYYKLANLQEKQHQFEDAVNSLKKAIEFEPNNHLFYRNLAQIQQILGNLEEAIIAYRQAIKINPDFELTVYRNLGQAIQQNNPVKARTGLSNLAEQLKNYTGKIAYLGATPTAQQDGYMLLLQEKLNKYFQQSHIAISAANGGITSNAAVFAMDRDVIKHQPDLCFIEYSSVDMGKGYEVGRAIEGMVKKLIAINCQICFLYLYQQGQKFDGSDPILSEYEKIAEFYGIPSINVGKYIEEYVKQGKFVFKDLFKSKNKTLPTGSKVVSEFIFNGLKDIFLIHKQNNSSLINQHTNEKRYIDNFNYAQAKNINIERSMIFDQDKYTVGKFKDYQYYQIDSANEIQFTIQGELVGITTIIGRDSGIISLKTAQYEREYKLWDSYCFEDRFQALIIQHYFHKPTLVSLRLTDKPIDYSKCINKIEDDHKIIKREHPTF